MERARMMASLGAEVVLVDQAVGSVAGQVSGDDLQLVFEETERLTHQHGAFRADQFELGGNARAHSEHTGPELVQQCRGAGYELDGFVDFVGSGGTFAGVAHTLRSSMPRAKCFVVEPTGAAVLSGRGSRQGTKLAPHKIQGGGYGMEQLTALASAPTPDGYLEVSSEEATETCRLLASHEGIFSGFSGGANVAAAAQLLRGDLAGGTIACMICDSGLKYLSTDLWQPEAAQP